MAGVDGGCLASVLHKSSSAKSSYSTMLTNVRHMSNCSAKSGNGGLVLLEIATGSAFSIAAGSNVELIGHAPSGGDGGIYLHRYDLGGDVVVNNVAVNLVAPQGNWTDHFANCSAAFGNSAGKRLTLNRMR